ncbi:MAG TPA: glycosyltransferase [Bacteroidales bacterium]|nr:glycosyltransferase [Bacteroidales bacterium]
MKKVCVLLAGAIHKDFRVIKTMNVLSRYCRVDLYYLKPAPGDETLFGDNVQLFPVAPASGLKQRILRHSFFYNEYNYLAREVIKQNQHYHFIWANDLTVLKPALAIKKTTGARLIYDSHEIYIETLNQFFPEQSRGFRKMAFGILLKFMKYFGTKAEKSMLRQVDEFVTVSNSVKNYFTETYKRNNIHVVLNCPAFEQSSYEAVDLKSMLGIDKNKFLLLYQGIMGYGRGLPLMIEAQKYTHDDVHFVLMGDGMLRDSLIRLTETLNLTHKITFIDRVPTSQLLQYTRAADGGIILQETDKNLSKKLGIANKLFEYMHAGIPFVASNAPENNAVAAQFNICLIVENNVQHIARGIDALKDFDPVAVKEEARKAAAMYNWEKQAEVISTIVQ